MEWIFRLAKSTGETWFEHSKNTYHIGRVLWELCQSEISKYFSKEEFLWCCLFHDAGKIIWKGFGDDHTSYSGKALSMIKDKKGYSNLLKQFELSDFSYRADLLKIIEDHHDNENKGSEFVTLADCIASSDFGYLSKLDSGSYSSYLKFLISDLRELQGFYLIKVAFPESSYLDRVKFGQIFLSKMLREAVWNLCQKEPETFYLFDVRNGCKVLTKTDPQNLRRKVCEAFKQYLLQRFEEFPILQFIGGQPQAAFRLRQYVFPEKYEFVLASFLKSCLIEVLGNIARSAKIKELPRQDEMTKFSIEELLEKLNEYTGITKDQIEKLVNYNSTWLGIENEDKTLLTENYGQLSRRKGSPKNAERIYRLLSIFEESFKEQPIILSILKEEGVINSETRYINSLIEPIAKYLIRRNAFSRKDKKYPDLQVEPLLSFITLNEELPIEVYATKREEVCAGCGVFRKYIEAGQIVTGFSEQQWREAIGHPKSPQPLCPLCYFSLLIYTYLTGTEKGKNIRPLDSAYLTLQGLNILNDIENFIQSGSPFSEEITRRLENFKKRFNFEKTFYYIPNIVDLDEIVYSITFKNPKDKFKEFPSIQKYSILSEVRDIAGSSENIFGISLQEKPLIRGPDVIATQEGVINLREIKDKLDLFDFLNEIVYEPKTLIFYFRLWQQNSAIALSRIIKDSSTQGKKVHCSDENFEKGVRFMSTDDQNFLLAKELWEIVALLHQLPSGKVSKYEVGKPVKKFKGTPESLDYNLNFLLKDATVGIEEKEEILKKAISLRDKLSKLDKKQQKDLDNYVKKTTHLFLHLAWQDIKSKGGEKNE